MVDRWILLPVLAVMVLLTIVSGCVTDTSVPANLTTGELADLYLDHANSIRDYRSEYTITSGKAGGTQFVSVIRYDYKSPSFARMEVVASDTYAPGTFATTNGTSTAWYDADTNTYDLSSGVDLFSGDYQVMVKQIVADRNFSIIARDPGQGRYLIEVATAPYSDTYTPYVSSRIRAWIEPSTGIAWNISTYLDCGASGIPTPTLPPVSAIQPGTCQPSDAPDNVIRYESVLVNTGIPDSYFDFIPPEGSGPRCVPKYANYVEPPRTDTSVPIDEPLPGGARYSLNESDSGRTVTLRSGEVLEIDLTISPGLAYRWMMPTEGSGLELMNAGPVYYQAPGEDDEPAFFKARGFYRWRYRAVSPGTETIDGVYGLGGCDLQGTKRFNLTVEVTE